MVNLLNNWTDRMERSRGRRYEGGLRCDCHLVGSSVSVGWFVHWLTDNLSNMWSIMVMVVSLLDLRIGWLSFIGHGGMEAIVIRHIADSLDPAIRQSDSVAASGHSGV